MIRANATNFYTQNISLSSSDEVLISNRDGTFTLVDNSTFDESKLIRNLFYDQDSNYYYFNYSATSFTVFEGNLYEKISCN